MVSDEDVNRYFPKTWQRENQDIFSPPSNILSLSTSESKRVPKRRPFILFIIFYEMKTKRLIILKTFPIFSWKRSQLCNYKYVIPRMVLKTASHVRCKCKRKRKLKCERVYTSNVNARKERYGSAVKVFFQDGRQWLRFCRFTRVGSERKYWLKKMKMFLLLGLTLAFAFAFALGGSHDQFLAFAIAFCWGLLVCLIDRGRCGY